MSAASLIVLVEGGLDAVFYERICERVLPNRRTFQLRKAIELPWISAGGGKMPLLAFFRYLRRRRLLKSMLGSKVTRIIFCLDKDIDDITRTKVRSVHVCYTEFYNLENYLYINGNLHSALSTASHNTQDKIRGLIPDPTSWRRQIALHWQEWVDFCILNTLAQAKQASWGSRSHFHHPRVRDPCDSSRQNAMLQAAAARCGLSAAVWAQLQKASTSIVVRRLSLGIHDAIFNGKWYTAFAIDDLRGNSLSSMSPGTLGEVIEATLLQTLDFEANWTDKLKNAIVAAANC